MTAAFSIDIKQKLVKKPEPNPMRPFKYHDRTQHILPNDGSELPKFLDNLKVYISDHQMQTIRMRQKLFVLIMQSNQTSYPILH